MLRGVDPARRSRSWNRHAIAGTDTGGIRRRGGCCARRGAQRPVSVAVAPDGTVFFADTATSGFDRSTPLESSHRGGTGNPGDGGDGGPATNATSRGLERRVRRLRQRAHIRDIEHNRVRKVTSRSGIIHDVRRPGHLGASASAATGLSCGRAEFAVVEAWQLTVRNVYIADVLNCRIARSMARAGSSTPLRATATAKTVGDGGPALAAGVSSPPARGSGWLGERFRADLDASNVVRRIDVVTGIISTVAGGGATTPGFGTATEMDLGITNDLVTDENGNLLVANRMRIFAVDLASNVLSVFAGTGVNGFGGDGGPATAADFNNIGGLAFQSTGELLVSDAGNHASARSHPTRR